MTIVEQLRDLPAQLPDAGFGALRTERGNLPLRRLDVRAAITGLTAGTQLTQTFGNPFDVALEATYVFPLPDRAALTALRMTVGDRVIEGVLEERAAARQQYDEAIAAGQRASIAEEERPDVFTLRVGNILPGEEVTVALTLAGPLALADGQAEFRFPLVVAPRYIPGAPLPGVPVGDGYAADTGAVPDASRISPPVLLAGFPNPVNLSIEVRVDPAGLPLAGIASSLHAVSETDGVLRIRPGERVDRDFILRLAYGDPSGGHSFTLTPDAGKASDDDREAAGAAQGTYQLTLLPPTIGDDATPRPKDLVLLLDRSGSMEGWKMVAARRAAARIVDTLTDSDRFAVLTFDHEVEHAGGLPDGLVSATDRHRFRAVEHLAGADARGGTELLAPLQEGLRLLAGAAGRSDTTDAVSRDRVLVLVTDGQVGNEDQILHEISGSVSGVRVHAVGIDQAVNAGFLGRLASVGGGRCELVESEDRLDEAMDRIHRRIGAPLVTGVRLHAKGLGLIDGSATPARVPDLFPGVPLVVRGRYGAAGPASVTVTGTTRDGEPWRVEVPATVVAAPSATAIWARSHLRDLEDRYAVTGGDALERMIVTASLRFGVLCRFTAYVAIDPRVVTDGAVHRVMQPVELPAGWAQPAAPMTGAAVPASPVGGMPLVLGKQEKQREEKSRPTDGRFRVNRGASSRANAAPRAIVSEESAEESFGVLADEVNVSSTTAPTTNMPTTNMPTTIMPPMTVSPASLARPTIPPPSPQPSLQPQLQLQSPSAPAVESTDRAGSMNVAEMASREARSLRAASAEALPARRDLLDDLASRLDAVARYLVAGGTAEALATLVTELRDETLPVEERWASALVALDALAAGHLAADRPEAVDPAGDPAQGRRRTAFWRRPS